MLYNHTVMAMTTNYTSPAAAEELDDSPGERVLLHLTLVAGYAFLGFFGWLLTL